MTDDNIETMDGLAKRKRVIGKHPALALPYYACECHERMGNDYCFLPMTACLRSDNRCSREVH